MRSLINDLRRVVDRHYFTNQYIESRALEERLATFYGYKHCISFANYILLACAVTDELLSVSSCNLDSKASLSFCSSSLSQRTHRFIKNTRTLYNPDSIYIGTSAGLLKDIEGTQALCRVRSLHFCRTYDSYIIGIRMQQLGFTASGAFMLTDSQDMLEILQNARCSYGVESKRIVHISSNGRFSEFQAVSLASVIE